MEKNKLPLALDESITQLLDELEAKFKGTEDKGEKWVISAKYNSVKYLYQLYNNTCKTINEFKKLNDL